MSNTPDTTNGAAPMQAANYTEADHEDYLNEIPLEDRAKSKGGRIPDDAQLGTWMRRHDRTAWNLSYQETVREMAFREEQEKPLKVARDCGHDMIPGAVAARIVSDIRAILYRDPEGAPDDGLDKFDPDKEWDSETLEAIAGTLEDAGLVPKDGDDYRDVRVAVDAPAAPVPVAAPSALEAAREACRVAELSLRAALAAMGAPEHRLAWLHLYDTIAPVAKVADRLQTLVDHAS